MPDWCPHCHVMLSPGVDQCPSCGARLKTQTPDPRGNLLSGKDMFWMSMQILIIASIPLIIGIIIAIGCVLSMRK